MCLFQVLPLPLFILRLPSSSLSLLNLYFLDHFFYSILVSSFLPSFFSFLIPLFILRFCLLSFSTLWAFLIVFLFYSYSFFSQFCLFLCVSFVILPPLLPFFISVIPLLFFILYLFLLSCSFPYSCLSFVFSPLLLPSLIIFLFNCYSSFLLQFPSSFIYHSFSLLLLKIKLTNKTRNK